MENEKLSLMDLIMKTDDNDDDGDSFSIEEIERVLEKEHPLFNVKDVLNDKVKNKESISILENELCYVNFIYDDRSVLVLHSTLNAAILAKHFAYPKEKALFDVDRYRYFPIDGEDDCIEITITKENAYANDEVITFINKFL